MAGQGSNGSSSTCSGTGSLHRALLGGDKDVIVDKTPASGDTSMWRGLLASRVSVTT